MDHKGAAISGIEYLQQRIIDAFRFPKNSVPLARGYGSNFHKLIDRNITDDLVMTAYEYAVETFNNAENGLDDCQFKRLEISTQDDHLVVTVFVTYEGDEVQVKV